MSCSNDFGDLEDLAAHKKKPTKAMQEDDQHQASHVNAKSIGR
jgi:hypothetical protein